MIESSGEQDLVLTQEKIEVRDQKIQSLVQIQNFIYNENKKNHSLSQTRKAMIIDLNQELSKMTTKNKELQIQLRTKESKIQLYEK